MIITKNNKKENAETVAQNDDPDLHKDEIGENSGEDTGLAKAFKQDPEKTMKSSNKDNGPAGENL